MTKQEIIADLKWRIKDMNKQIDDGIKELNDMPSEEKMKEDLELAKKLAYSKQYDCICARNESPEWTAYMETAERAKNLKAEREEKRMSVALNMARLDALDRFYNTIIDSEK